MNKGSTCGCGSCAHEPCTRRVPIFSALNEEETGRITGLILHRSYMKGSLLIMEGSELENLVIINRGRVKAFRDTAEGREQILYIFSEGDFFGEKNLLSNRKATYSVQALDETEVCMINKSDFQELLRKYPDIGLKVMEELCGRLDRLENAIESMGVKNVEARVSAVLLEFLKEYGREHPKGYIIELPMSREGIANYIGLTRETVSRKLSLLQDEGVIKAIGNKKILVLDKKALEESTE